MIRGLLRSFAGPLLAIVVVTATIISAAGEENPPKELVQYIQNAMRLGVKEPMIVQNAIAVGWPEPVVNSTMAYVKGEPKAADQTAAPADPPAGSKPAAAAAPPADPPAGSKPAGPAPSPTVLPANPSPAPSKAVDAGPGHVTEPPAISNERGVPDDYLIGAGDVLHINVWKEPDASVPTAVVRPDGKISMPLLKEVEVMGLTCRQAEAVITEGLSKMITGVDVTVIVTAINSKKVYIVGAAKKEGPLTFTYRMTVMQAISEAGGLTDYAKRKKIYVLHTDNGKEYRLPFNYDEVIKGEKTEQNILLSPGDTLFIPH